jgi:hypothetical protein
MVSHRKVGTTAQRLAIVSVLFAISLQAAEKDFEPQPLVTSDPIPRAPLVANKPEASPSPSSQQTHTASSSYPKSVSTVPAAGTLSIGSYPTPPSTSSAEQRTPSGSQPDFNEVILRLAKEMPKAGGYSVSSKAAANLRKAIGLDMSGNLTVTAARAQPSFCSGATYLLFLMVLGDLEKTGAVKIDKKANESLLHKSQADGVGVWGRWNANGPGVARLFYELRAGENFTDIRRAKPGDFLKIWWTEEIGSKEKGHLVVYLGRRMDESGEEFLRFWSSNIPDGYGTKEVPVSKAKRMLFSRLTHPSAFNNAPELPAKDDFLASMLKKSFSMDEVLEKTGAN